MNEREPWYVGVLIAVGLVLLLSTATTAWSGDPTNVAGSMLLYGFGALPFLLGYYVRGLLARLCLFGVSGALLALLFRAFWPDLADPSTDGFIAIGEALALTFCIVVEIAVVVGTVVGIVVNSVARRYQG